ncbi:TrmB family transcriptional regulator [Sporosarcina limicola]|uniref:Sugar-specific transcriptional regulator TrmB n=1 Tax=Sporosarcina limicola TaxID=34101 RepID=A0A927R4A6_9BACL|nr:TrmB family transcriptional regulator [Sporosarcina limicola]MBE1555976.1 sugar-specific transcriptional regulator TrmB [Sporosarcina limicola]
MESKIHLALEQLGFSIYECKAYIGLLKHSPITGYEVSKRTGVPRSMIYEVLGKLLDKGAIYTVPSEPVKYSPLNAADLIDRMKKSFDQSFDFLKKELTTLESEQEIDTIWRIKSDKFVLEEMNELILKATNEVWLSIWEPQTTALEPSILQKEKEGITFFSLLFGASDKKYGHTYHHNYMPPEVVSERIGGHLSIVARDHEEVIIANFLNKGAAWAVKTKDPALVLVAIEYIRHDIMIEEITQEYGAEKLDYLWRNRQDLTAIVSGKR